MSKLPVLSGKELIKILSKNGFQVLGQQGSHVILLKILSDGRKLKPVVPMHPVIKPGTFLSILKQANLTRQEFEELIK